MLTTIPDGNMTIIIVTVIIAEIYPWPPIYLTQLAKQVPRGMQGFDSLWYYIGGSVATVIVISLIACFFCKCRRTGEAQLFCFILATFD